MYCIKQVIIFFKKIVLIRYASGGGGGGALRTSLNPNMQCSLINMQYNAPAYIFSGLFR